MVLIQYVLQHHAIPAQWTVRGGALKSWPSYTPDNCSSLVIGNSPTKDSENMGIFQTLPVPVFQWMTFTDTGCRWKSKISKTLRDEVHCINISLFWKSYHRRRVVWLMSSSHNCSPHKWLRLNLQTWFRRSLPLSGVSLQHHHKHENDYRHVV